MIYCQRSDSERNNGITICFVAVAAMRLRIKIYSKRLIKILLFVYAENAPKNLLKILRIGVIQNDR